MNLRGTAVAILLSAACIPTQAASQVGSAGSLDTEIRAYLPAARKALELQLFDYPSTRFLDVKAARGANDNTILCGYLNAKNRDGGYIGFRQFMMFRNYIFIESPMPWKTDQEAEENGMRIAWCGKDATPIAANIKDGRVSTRDWTPEVSYSAK